MGRLLPGRKKPAPYKRPFEPKIESYENELAEVRARTQEEQNQINDELKEKEEERIRATFEEAAQMVASTQQALQEETKRIRQELGQQAEGMARMMTEKVLGRKVS